MVIMTSSPGVGTTESGSSQSSSPLSTHSEAHLTTNSSSSDQQLWLQSPPNVQAAGQPRPPPSQATSTPHHSLPHASMQSDQSNTHTQPIIIPQVSFNYALRPYQDLASPLEDLEGMKSISLNQPIYLHPFPVIDRDEEMVVKEVNHFMQNLGLSRSDGDEHIKVVTVVGNAGEGKSHALNHVFCGGTEVFRTVSSSGAEDDSSNSDSGAVCAFLAKERRALLLDTPGKAGTGFTGHKTNRLLYKVMAVSDIIIYRTRSERLQFDMFEFLSGFTSAYNEFMKQDLHDLVDKGESEFAQHRPVLLICHDTRSTRVLTDNSTGTASQQVAALAERLGFSLDVFCRLTYIGSCHDTRSQADVYGKSASSHRVYIDASSADDEDCLTRLKQEVHTELQSTLGRKSRRYSVVHAMLKMLSMKYSEEVIEPSDMKFPHYMFRCQERCKVCSAHCSRSMNHQRFARERTITDETNRDSSDCNGLDISSSSSANNGNRGTPEGRAVALKERAHFSSTECTYADYYKNKRYICSLCLKKGVKSVVLHRPYDSKQGLLQGLVNLAMSGTVFECSECSAISSSRPSSAMYSSEPDSRTTKLEHIHVWPSQPSTGYSTTTHTSRQVFPSVSLGATGPELSSYDVVTGTDLPSATMTQDPDLSSYICGLHPSRKVLENVHSTVTNLASTLPNLGIANWFNTNYVNPSYWKPDDQCTHCDKCRRPLTEGIHHCRKCGLGFCELCSTQRMLVPERNWGDKEVRVCDDCFKSPPKPVAKEEALNTTRQVTESVYGFFSAATSTAAGIIRSTTRPDYWEADEEITQCKVCKEPFDPVRLPLHHCRDCGGGVCDPCSPHRVPVKHRGWDSCVRVCTVCFRERPLVEYQEP